MRVRDTCEERGAQEVRGVHTLEPAVSPGPLTMPLTSHVAASRPIHHAARAPALSVPLYAYKAGWASRPFREQRAESQPHANSEEDVETSPSPLLQVAHLP